MRRVMVSFMLLASVLFACSGSTCVDCSDGFAACRDDCQSKPLWQRPACILSCYRDLLDCWRDSIGCLTNPLGCLLDREAE